MQAGFLQTRLRHLLSSCPRISSYVFNDVAGQRGSRVARSSLKSTHRHSTLDLQSSQSVIVKIEGHAFSHVPPHAVLEVEVHMRFAAVARVPHAAEDLPCRHAIARCDRDGSRLQMSHEEILIGGHFQDHVITRRTKKPGLPDRAVRFTGPDEASDAVGRSEDPRQSRPPHTPRGRVSLAPQ
jgi:hypothetical protein